MYQSVGNNDVWCLMNVVVPGNLVENGLRKRDMGSLTFDHQKRLTLPVEDYHVRTLLGFIQRQATLGPNQGFGVSIMRKQQIDDVLPNPLFGRQPDVLSA